MSENTTTDLEAKGYEDLREYITSAEGWSHVALLDAAGDEETRIEIDEDSRTEWSDPESNPVELTIAVEGDDSDIDTPVELAESALFNDVAADDPVHIDLLREDEDGEPANVILGGNDTLEVIHSIELPEVSE